MTIFTPEFKKRVSNNKSYLFYFLGYCNATILFVALKKGWI